MTAHDLPEVVDEMRETNGIDWITALKSASIRALVEQGRNLFELEALQFPGERLVACGNPASPSPASSRPRCRANSERAKLGHGAGISGIWRLYIADFVVNADGEPAFVNKRDITPSGARWVEPGNFAPDGRRLLLSADIGIEDAQGQDQFILDIETGQILNLTHSPDVWDEHGLFSADGSKITFISSFPYRHEKETATKRLR